MAIQRYLGTNYGSLLLIEYISSQNIVAFLPSGRGAINAAGISILPGAGWTSIYCSEDNMGHQQVKADDVNGESWKQTVAGFTPGDQADIESGILDLDGSRYIVRITRPDGTLKIVGTLKEPLDLTLDSNSQMTVPGAAGTMITFTGITSRRALIYSA